jgi:hypothetical protein
LNTRKDKSAVSILARWKRLAALACTLLLSAGLASAAATPPSPPIASTTVSDWSTKLDDSWGCNTLRGPRWDQWKKSALLFGSSNGYGFRAFCNKATGMHGEVRPDTVLVVFRDPNKITQYVGWYDGALDRDNNAVFGGLTPVTAQTDYDIRYGASYKQHPLYTPEDHLPVALWLQDMYYNNQNVWAGYMAALQRAADESKVKGCVLPYTRCGTGELKFAHGPIGGYVTLNILLASPDGANLEAYFHDIPGYKPGLFDKFVSIGLTVGLTLAGGPIGESIGLLAGTAENAAFSAAFGSFVSGLGNGQSVEKSLLQGIKAGGLAYTGKLFLNAYGDPGSLVGVEGAGCPLGDQCWYFQMANGFPPLKNLAELHDPFITWSEKAFGSIAENGWYKAVTIAPFIVPGCLSSAPCVTGGMIIVRDDEVN